MSDGISISKVSSRAIDKLDNLNNSIKFAKQQQGNKRVIIGDYLSGQIPIPQARAGLQSAAGRLNND